MTARRSFWWRLGYTHGVWFERLAQLVTRCRGGAR